MKDHVNTCDVRVALVKSTKKKKGVKNDARRVRFSSQELENLAKERIFFLRNTVWTHLNQLSQQCVTNDEVGTGL